MIGLEAISTMTMIMIVPILVTLVGIVTDISDAPRNAALPDDIIRVRFTN